MPKGMFTQCACILLDRAATLDEIESALANFKILAKHESGSSWELGGPSVTVAYLPECNGLVTVDTVAKPWPDHMGDAKEELSLFAAWSMGHFGPFAFPGGLQRAAEQSWTWDPGRSIPTRHKAFIRVRSSYVFGAKNDSPIMPANYEPLPELEFVTKLAGGLLEIPGAICYFNPNGEVLRNQDGLRESLNFGWTNDLPPLDVWSNIRLFNINAEWSLMDSVGNGQLDIPDIEACFHTESYNLSQVDNFLRNVSLYVLQKGEVIEAGDTMDGPGGIRWQSNEFENGICDPPRRVLRWIPMDNRPLPTELLGKE